MTHPNDFPTFEEFFTAVHRGRLPYPWQRELASRVATGQWPPVIEIPTGLGKTTTIAAAVYELAHQCHLLRRGELEHRTAPQRIFHVVNRRSLVEDTGGYIDEIAHAINSPGTEQAVLLPVRKALQTLPGGKGREAVVATSLHGSRRAGREWMRASGCVIVTLTPHQFVSRLLMRGFGVSAGTRSIHAGLLGIDRLVLFDEPHLATPAIHAILDSQKIQEQAPLQLGVPLGEVVILGATLSPQIRSAVQSEIPGLSLDPGTASDSNHDEMSIRLGARRQMAVHQIATASDGAFAKELAALAKEAVETAEHLVVFVNTVSLAQAVYQQLQHAKLPVQLITSRFRPLDRRAKVDRQAKLTVATQCLEVGVDISFDTMITELCPWNTLVQRLGRLNRYGISANDSTANAHIVTAASGKLRDGSAAVYDADTLSVMHSLILEEVERPGETIDVSLAGLRSLRALADTDALEARDPRAGTLHPGLLPVMIQTRPTPFPDIPVGAFIAGPDAPRNTDVDVAWRSWLEPLKKKGTPVYELEQVSVPVAALRRFLTEPNKAVPISDQALVKSEPSSTASEFDAARVLIWDQQNELWRHPAGIEDLYSTDRVVLSTELGGYTPALGWTARPDGEVSDVSLVAALAQMEDSELDSSFQLNLTAESVEALKAFYGDNGSANELLVCKELEEPFKNLEKKQADGKETVEEPTEEELIEAAYRASKIIERLLPETVKPLVSIEPTYWEWYEEYKVQLVLRTHRSSENLGNLPLDEHQRATTAEATDLAHSAGIRKDLLHHLAFAARFHDEGKKDARFQHLLSKKVDAPLPDPLLAKSVSGISPGSPRDRARRRFLGIPEGWRHESESLKRIPRQDFDILVRHLIGSHHGWYRPGFRPIEDEQIEGVSHSADFNRLNELFGPWGLAYLESLLRLADHTVSKDNSKVGTELSFVAQPLPSVQGLQSSQRSTLPRENVELSGLRSQTAIGWYVSVGLLGAASDLGDTEATVQWKSPLVGGTPNLPVLSSSIPLHELVEYLCSSKLWSELEETTAEGTGQSKGITRKNQKLTPARTLRPLLCDAAARLTGDSSDLVSRFILGLVGDLSSAGAEGDAGQVELPISTWANNSSYPGVAVKCVAEEPAIELAEKSLLSENAGYAQVTCDGGLDRHPGLRPQSNGLGAPGGERFTRPYLAPLVVAGMAYLGHAGAKPIGLDSNGRKSTIGPENKTPVPTLRLPLSSTPVTLPEMRALSASVWTSDWEWAAIGAGWVLEFARNYRDKSEIFWEGGPRRRS